MEDKEMVKRER